MTHFLAIKSFYMYAYYSGLSGEFTSLSVGYKQITINCETLSIFFLKVGETSTHVLFLLGFWLIYSAVILPANQTNHSQSTPVKEIVKNQTCSWISCL